MSSSSSQTLFSSPCSMSACRDNRAQPFTPCRTIPGPANLGHLPPDLGCFLPYTDDLASIRSPLPGACRLDMPASALALWWQANVCRSANRTSGILWVTQVASHLTAVALCFRAHRVHRLGCDMRRHKSRVDAKQEEQSPRHF